jgi:hypothetical protein
MRLGRRIANRLPISLPFFQRTPSIPAWTRKWTQNDKDRKRLSGQLSKLLLFLKSLVGVHRIELWTR